MSSSNHVQLQAAAREFAAAWAEADDAAVTDDGRPVAGDHATILLNPAPEVLRGLSDADLASRMAEIKPDVVDPDDVEMLQDLLLAAFNEAQSLAAEATEEKMAPFTDMLDMGSLGGLL